MKFLSRMIAVVALLGVLAYGSYAFGMYVLSAKLFGESANSKTLRNVSRSTTEASAITRQTGWKGTKPRVEVKVLPSDESGAGSPLPAYADEDGFQKQSPDESDAANSNTDNRRDSSSSEPAPTVRLGNRKFDDGSAEYSLGDENTTRRRSSRRHRRSRSHSDKSKASSASDSAQVSASGASSSEDRTDNNDSGHESSSNNNSDNDGSGDRAVINDKPARENASSRETPRATEARPRETTRRRNSSTHARPRESSPIPRPEGSRASSGGDSASISPVPQPE